MSQNRVYQTEQIERYYSRNRCRWEELYPSERWVFERSLAAGTPGSVLDVGCAAGGLAQALGERLRPNAWVGVDINAPAIAAARRTAGRLPFPSEFICGDICDCPDLGSRTFDWVTGLSVVDWNIEATPMLEACWQRVAPGGVMILSLRLSPDATVSDVERSFQYIWFEGGGVPADAERAQYTVFNVDDALRRLCNLGPSTLLAYGYWGTPSVTARTPFARLLFSVVALRKRAAGEESSSSEPRLELHWPAGALLEASGERA